MVGVSDTIEAPRELEFDDGSKKWPMLFAATIYGENALGAAWRCFKNLLSQTYLPEGPGDGRRPKDGFFHGDFDHKC